jgi:hypothetical protein
VININISNRIVDLEAELVFSSQSEYQKILKRKIQKYKSILHNRELKRYGEELEIIKQIIHGNFDLFIQLISEIHILNRRIVFFFKDLNKVYIEIVFREHPCTWEYPKSIVKRCHSSNCTLIPMYDY